MQVKVHKETYTKMVNRKETIPWESEETWAQVVFSIGKTISVLSAEGSEIKKIKTIARQIVQGYAEIATVLERICLITCPTCLDLCCSRATVWYDLKDLLLVYLNTGILPGRQIYRQQDQSCCNLTSSGCRLLRSDRPFLCTWYICPDQKKILERLSDNEERLTLFRTLDKLKIARKELEEEYVKAICD